MAGTIKELNGVKPSGSGVPAYDTFTLVLDGGSGFSEPILLGGRKVVSIQSNGPLAATDITIQGTNFSSRTTTDANTDYRDGMLIPLDADFNNWYDKANALIQIMGTTGQQGWSIGEVGFPVWIRLNLSVPQVVTFYISAKG